MKNSEYCEDIYEVVAKIPRGRVTTYGAIADFLALGSARMVGWALKQLGKTSHEVPAHRVVNSKGELSGKLAFGHPDMMRILLEEDGVKVEDDRVINFKRILWNPSEAYDH